MDTKFEKEISRLIDHAQKVGIFEQSIDDKLTRFGDELDFVLRNKDLYGKYAWIEPERGIVSTAMKFFRNYEHKIRQKLCDADNGGLKQKYLKLIEKNSSLNLVQSLANAIAAAIDPEFIIPSLVVTLAIWLASTNLDSWCRLNLDISDTQSN